MVRQKEKNRNGLEKERKNKPFKGGVFIFMERYFCDFFFFFFLKIHFRVAKEQRGVSYTPG